MPPYYPIPYSKQNDNKLYPINLWWFIKNLSKNPGSTLPNEITK